MRSSAPPVPLIPHVPHARLRIDAQKVGKDPRRIGKNRLPAIGAVMFPGRLGRTGAVVAMGGYKLIGPDAAEVKSMHVTEAARRQGAGAHILTLILDHARRAGARQIWLETGSLPASSAARRLYARAGFVTCPPFGEYQPDPMCIFMTRTL